MLTDPTHWGKYYSGERGRALSRLQPQRPLAYYWPIRLAVQAALERLLRNLQRGADPARVAQPVSARAVRTRAEPARLPPIRTR